MKTSALDIVAETKSAIAFRVNGQASGEGRAAVVYFSPTISLGDAAMLLRTVADRMETTNGGSA